MSRFWSAATRELEPYVPGEQPRIANLIKLNTNEHPLPPSDAVMRAIADVAPDALRRYPDPQSLALRCAIGQVENLSPDCIHVGNGSDEVLAQIFQGLLASSEHFYTLDITYSFYPVWAKLYGLQARQVPLNDDFSVNLDALCQCDGPVLIPNPNAPTGIALSYEQILQLVRSNSDRLVVIDEAYFGFGADSACSLIPEHDNLVVTRTLSKSYALAGLRLGFAMANPRLIDGLVRLKDSFNSYPIDAIAQAAGLAAISDQAWFDTACRLVADNRHELTTGLKRLDFKVCSSAANFVFAEHTRVSGETLFDRLREQGILVRRWQKPRISNHLRITVGTQYEVSSLLDALLNCTEN